MAKTTKSGRKPLVDNEVDSIFRKLEPFLKRGLSLHKACLEARIPKSTAYDLYQEYDEFAERIDACKNYHSLGKMLLGIAFVLSKQYSDQLSDNVKRGIRRSIEEGKYLGRTKYGYYAVC